MGTTAAVGSEHAPLSATGWIARSVVGATLISIAAMAVWSLVVDPDTRASPDLDGPEILVLSVVFGVGVGIVLGTLFGFLVWLVASAAQRSFDRWNARALDVACAIAVSAVLSVLWVAFEWYEASAHGRWACDQSCLAYTASTDARDLRFFLLAVAAPSLAWIAVTAGLRRRHP